MITTCIQKLTDNQPWGEGPNDLDLDRYCNLLALDLEDIMAHPQKSEGPSCVSSLRTLLGDVNNESDRYSDHVDSDIGDALEV